MGHGHDVGRSAARAWVYVEQVKKIAFLKESLIVCFVERKPDNLTDTPPVIAVLSGDLVRSQKYGADDINTAMEQLSRSARYLGDMYGTETRFTRFRGDGWQIVLTRPGLALRAALVMIADLKRAGCTLETRISVGIGGWTSLGSDDLSDASGGAFILSGKQLDDMPRHRRLSISIGGSPNGETESGWPAAIFDMAEWIASRWSAPQAEAIAIALRGDWKTQEQLANYLGITRQAMHARLSGAGYQVLEKALAVMENNEWEPAP
jgi:hypothetical protein